MMSIIREAAVSRAPMLGLSAVGVCWGGFAAYVPDLKASLQASDSVWGAALILSALGGICAMSLIPRYIAHAGRATLPLAGIALALACIGPALPSTIWGLGAALFVMGAAVSLLDISSNVRISVLEDRHGLHLMNLNHAAFSFAFAGSAAAVSLARKAGALPSELAPFVALGVAALALAMIEGRDWQDAPRAPAGSGSAQAPWAVVLPAAAILFAAFVCENGAEVWSALHIERTLGGPAGDGGFGPMMLGLMMGFGRLSGQIAARRLGAAQLVLWSALVGVAGALVLAFAPTPGVALIGVGLLGLGVAVVVPSANSMLGRAVAPELLGVAISRAWMIGFSGFFLGPTIIGLVSQLTSLRLAFVFVAVVMASVIPAVRLMQRRGG